MGIAREATAASRVDSYTPETIKSEKMLNPMGTPAFILTSVTTSLVAAIGIVKFGAGAMTGVCLAPWLIVLFHYYPFLLVLLWLTLLFFTMFSPGAGLYLHDISFLPLDPAYFFSIVCLIAYAATRKNVFMKTLKENPFLCIFMSVVILYVILGTPVWGQRAIGEARKFYFYFLFPLLTAFSMQTYQDLRRLLSAVFFVAIGITVIGLLYLIRGLWFGHGLPADAVQILLCAVFAILVSHINGMVVTNRILDSAMLLLFLSLIIKAGHRSVFLESALGLCIFGIIYRNRIVFLSKSVVMLVVVGLMISSVPGLEQWFTKSISGIVSPASDQTASWRMRGWQDQWERIVRTNLLFGEGLGSYYSWKDKETGAHVKGIQPHNAYIQILMKFGLVGLLVYGLLVYKFFRHTLAVRKRLPPGPLRAYVEMGIVNFGAAHAYMMGYGFSLIIFVFYALGMGAARFSASVLESLPDSSRRGFAMAGRDRAAAYDAG